MIHITSLSQATGPITMRPAARSAVGAPSIQLDTILVVEDDATMRLALACMVADPHRQVVLAHNADDALDRLPLINPDVVLCDYMLEGRSGREFCQEMKRARRWRHVPIIMVTRLDDPAVVADLLKSGADEVLTKPVRGEVLRDRVQCRLRACVPYPEPGLEMASISFQA